MTGHAREIGPGSSQRTRRHSGRRPGGKIIRVLFIGAHLGKGGGVALQAAQTFEVLRRSIDVEMLCLDAPGLHSSLANRPGVHLAGNLEFPKGIELLRRALRASRDDYDVFQVLDPYYALPASFLAQVSPRVVNFGTDPGAEVDWRFGHLAGVVTRAAMLPFVASSTLVVNSRSLASRFRRFGPHVIPNGVDLDKFDHLPAKTETRRALGLPEDRTILVFVGKVIPVKRIEWILEVVRRVPGAIAVVVGGYREPMYGDQYYRGLRAAYPEVQDRVLFVGEVPWSDVAAYLAAADIFVFPSRFEGLPNAVMEAMAAGLPVVLSDIPAHHELIRHGRTGFLASDPKAMAHVVAELSRDESSRQEVGSSARHFIAEHFSVDACAKAYVDLYQAVLRGDVDATAPHSRRLRKRYRIRPGRVPRRT